MAKTFKGQNTMGERQDYIALEWVAGEIGDTLKQAAQALEAYIANRDDATKLRFCLTHIHQVHGTLQMVEFFGAALLAKEMEDLVQALVQSTIAGSHIEDALVVLKNAIEQLPLYLERVKKSRHGLPAALLPILNDLRAVRGESLLSETVLFAPDLRVAPVARLAEEAAADTPLKGSELVDVTHKLRQMFQIALLGLIRGNDVKKNLNYLAKVCVRLVKLSAGSPLQPLWKVCIAELEGLLNGSIDASVAVKILLRQVDRQIKLIIDLGDAALEQSPPEDLLKNLLYYVARSKANSKFIKEIKAEYKLDVSLLGEGELDDDTLAAPDSMVMQAVVEALAQELNDINVALASAGNDSAALADVLPLFRRVSDTMAILGMGSLLKQVQEPYSQLAKLLATQDIIATTELDQITRQITAAKRELNPSAITQEHSDEQALSNEALSNDALFNDSEEAQQQLDSAFSSVVFESRNGLEHAKEAIIEFVATQWDHDCLSDVPELLAGICGSLNMVPLARAASIVQSCERYVSQVLLATKAVPEWQMLDTLADAITSVDYYLERLVDDADVQGDAILDVAAESVAELGYPVAAIAADEVSNVDESDPESPVLDPGSSGYDSSSHDSLEHDSLEQEIEPAAEQIDRDQVLAEVIPFQSPTAFKVEDADAGMEQDIPVLTKEVVADNVVADDVVVDDVEEEPDAEQNAEAGVAEEFDPEIVEIFIEEAGEVLDSIAEVLPQWRTSADDDEARSTIRRAFHTLKGSGRMVGAVDIGELAWSVENMLNRVIEGSVKMDQHRFDLLAATSARIPEMVDAFEHRKPFDKTAVDTLIEQANALATEQNPVFNQHNLDPQDLNLQDNAEPVQTEPLSSMDTIVELPVLENRYIEDAVAEDHPLEEINEEVDSTAAELVQDDEIDTELLDIFAAETVVHGQALDDFIAHCKRLAGPAELTDELQRALHTLKGSANMAGVQPVAMVVTPIEHLVRELRSSQLKVDPVLVEVLERGSLFIKAGIEQLETTPMQILPGTEDYIEQLTTLLNDRLAQATDQAAEDKGIAPDALNQFLTDSLDRIMDISEHLARLENAQSDVSELEGLEKCIDQFIDHAESVNMLVLVELGQAMQVLYRTAREVRSGQLGVDFFVLAARGNDSLIDMLDQIAGHQNPSFDQQLFSDIQDFEFVVAEETVELLAAEPDAVADIEFGVDALDRTVQMEAISDDDTGDDDTGDDDTGDDDIGDYGTDDYATDDYDINEDLVDALSADEELLAEADIVELNLDAMMGTRSMPAEEQFTEQSTEQSTQPVEEQEPAKEQPVIELVDDAEIIAAMSELVEAINEPVVNAAEQAETVEPEPEPEPEPVSFASSAQAIQDDEELDAEIIEIFMEEADELLEAIDEAVHSWTGDRDNREYLDDLLRILHTLKGGARLAGLTQMGNLSHNFETLLIGLESQGPNVSDATLNDIQNYQDQLIAQLAAIKAGETVADVDLAEELTTVSPATVEQAELENTEQDYSVESTDDIASEESFDEGFDIEGLELEESELDDDVQATDDAHKTSAPMEETSASVVPFTGNKPRAVSALEVPSPLVDLAARKGPQEVVKVSAQLLEELVNLAGETSISRGRAEEQISELVFSLDEMQITVDRLQEQVRRLDMETEQQILYRQEQVESEGLEGFDPLEMDRYSALQQLSHSLLESSSDLIDIKSTLSDKSRDMETLLVQQSRINTDLQEGLMRSRMVPFSRMVPRLRRIIRQVSGELNKKVDFHLDNIEGELDRTVLERMVAPLEHMLRNAVDHGIESAEQRAVTGKPSRGSVTLGLSREGGEIVLTLSDDGAGIDLKAVKHKAIERGLMEANADLSDHEILQFIVQAGFSTATEITQISGRGVGMDVVHSEIKQLGGSMDIDSVVGKGSRFTVRLPFTVSVNRALMVNVGGDRYAIPLNTIEGIVRVSPFELEAYYQPDAPMFEYAGQPYLLRYMGALLHRGEKPILEGQSMPLPVVLVRGAEHSVAVQVDSLMGSREIVVKPLGPQFSMVQGLSGATVLGDGSVVVILDLLAMIRADASHLHRDLIFGKDTSGVEDRSILVMVVDDSVTVRKVTSRFLERQGMDVVLAKDGVDAITQLQELERIPDVMLLDIEMPRMDGFEVASRVRHNSRLKDIPIIMITSRTGEKHRERAMSLGVNEYMGKPYQETALLENIKVLTGAEIE